jgi:hypothetical protein
MTAQGEENREAYDKAMAQKAVLGHQLFELLVWDNWYGTLSVALHDYGSPNPPRREPSYRSEPEFDVGDYPNYIGGSTLQQARKFKAAALGEEVTDDRLKELVEELLKDELEKYNIELRWMYRNAWDGQDRILCIYPKA